MLSAEHQNMGGGREDGAREQISYLKVRSEELKFLKFSGTW